MKQQQATPKTSESGMTKTFSSFMGQFFEPAHRSQNSVKKNN
jgi:hypothetical protein